MIFECHQPSKIRRLVLKRCLKNENAKVIFLNKKLYLAYKKYIKFDKNSIILENGYRESLFDKKIPKKKKIR